MSPNMRGYDAEERDRRSTRAREGDYRTQLHRDK